MHYASEIDTPLKHSGNQTIHKLFSDASNQQKHHAVNRKITDRNQRATDLGAHLLTEHFLIQIDV